MASAAAPRMAGVLMVAATSSTPVAPSGSETPT